MKRFRQINARIGGYRWVICALLFFATTLNYLDRAVIGLLKEHLTGIFSWTESDYSNIVVCFQIAYAVSLLVAGAVIDRIGTKAGYAASIVVWSLAAIAHGFATGTWGFAAARAALGAGESGNFPAANKTVAEWFPRKERALATGLYNSGANIGAIIAPLIVPWIAVTWGWQWAFILTGVIGFVWLVFWVLLYTEPRGNRHVTPAELAYIEEDAAVTTPTTTPDTTMASAAPGTVDSRTAERRIVDPSTVAPRSAERRIVDPSTVDPGTVAPRTTNSSTADPRPAERRAGWCELLRCRQTWAFFFGKFFTDPVWWFFLFWLPAFLQSEYGLSVMQVSLPLIAVYTLSSAGSVFGGWLPKYLIQRGRSVSSARKTSMLLYAFVPLLVLFTQGAGGMNMWYAILIIALACAAHCAWSANLFATVSDMFPQRAVATVTGIGGMAGAVGGILVAKAAGLLFDHFKAQGDIGEGYAIMFVVCALSYVVAWGVMQALAPGFKRVDKL